MSFKICYHQIEHQSFLLRNIFKSFFGLVAFVSLSLLACHTLWYITSVAKLCFAAIFMALIYNLSYMKGGYSISLRFFEDLSKKEINHRKTVWKLCCYSFRYYSFGVKGFLSLQKFSPLNIILWCIPREFDCSLCSSFGALTEIWMYLTIFVPVSIFHISWSPKFPLCSKICRYFVSLSYFLFI